LFFRSIAKSGIAKRQATRNGDGIDGRELVSVFPKMGAKAMPDTIAVMMPRKSDKAVRV
jgi:hypothetical protein